MSDDLFKRTGAEDFSKYLKVMISGPPKSGKTTLLGTVPNILVLDTEPHANNLDSVAHLDLPYATITNSEDLRYIASILGNDSLRKQMAQAKYGLPDIKGVAIDTLDTLQKILKAERLKDQRSTQFLRDDWGWLKTEMESIIEAFTALPMHVFFVVHTKSKEIGKGDDAYTVVLPGLEGAISETIAGMVGYSLLSFRKEEIAADGTLVTKYWLRTEGDTAHDFLGTRTAGKLPTIIEPNIKTIYDTVMANRPAPKAPKGVTPPAAPPVEPEKAAQNPGQAQEVQTSVETSTAAPVATPEATPEAPAASAATAPPEAERPGDSEPISPAAMGHVKRVYDAVEIAFPEAVVKEMNMGEARQVVKYWRAIQSDHNEGKAVPGTSPQSEMIEILGANGWLPPEGAGEPEPKPEASAKIDGTIEEVMAYVAGDLTKVQAAYDLEIQKGDGARKGLIAKLEGLGAKTPEAPTAPAEEVQTPVETPAAAPEEPVTPAPTAADTPPTEDEAVKAVEEGLGGTVVSQGINADAPCDVCGQPIDDLDLAELGQKRFSKVLCVNDYLAELKK